LEETRAERLDLELEEAAAFGRQLLAANEELQHELAFFRREETDQEQPSPGVEPEPNFFRKQLRRCSTESTKLTCDRREPSETSSGRRKSVDLLANEYESDLQDLIAQNKALNDKAQQLERDNRALQDKILQDNINEANLMRDDVSQVSSRTERRGSLMSDTRLPEVLDLESREDALKSELDDERANAWELEQRLAAANHEASELHNQVGILVGECQVQQGTCEAKEAEVESLQQRIQELTDAVQAQRVAESTATLLPATPEGRRYESFFTSLERDMQTACPNSGCNEEAESGPRSPPKSKADLELYRQVEELREQLVGAEDAGRESRKLRSELALQRREAERLREQLRGVEEHAGRGQSGADGAAAEPHESASPSTSSSAAAAAAAVEEAQSLRTEAAELRRRLAASEAESAEAREAAGRQRELNRRARQASQREAEELRERLLSAEDRAWRGADHDSHHSQRELLTKIDQLQRGLQAETKARRFIEAELLRTLAGIRNMDTELHAC